MTTAAQVTAGITVAAQVMANNLALDPASRAAGYAAGFVGARWRPAEGQDWLAYAAGYLDGASERTALQRREAAHG